MAFNPSSIVKTAPHFGHFTFASLPTMPAQPKENTAKTANAKTMLTSFFTPLHLLSFGRYLQKYNNASPSILGQLLETGKKLKPIPISISKIS